MYATCLFCNNALGANDALEKFPVGRRLAFDAAKGRLWVICTSCNRWNLSPLETRWEAIEDAERAFRDTKLRVSTENIGLARLREGLELVRIGAPERPEFAAWRYGAQFGRRYKKAMVASTTVIGMSVLPTAINMFGSRFGASIGLVPVSVMLAASTGFTTLTKYKQWLFKSQANFAIRDDAGNHLRLTRANAARATIFPSQQQFDWQLTVPHVDLRKATGWSRMFGHRQLAGVEHRPAFITGDAAQRALATILPAINTGGGNKSAVNDAVDLLVDSPTLGQMLRGGVVRKSDSNKFFRLTADQTCIREFPAHVRLAMEMSLHEDDERRAMEGELHDLEQRWKDADAIAKISDEMFLPEHVDTMIDSMKSKSNGRAE